MQAQLKELLPFLHDKNPQVRQIALSNLLAQTPKGSPHRSIFFAGTSSGGLTEAKESDVIRDLKLLCRDQAAIAHDAFRALVNLSDSPVLVSTLSEPSFLTFIVAYIISPRSVLADLASMLLSNLSSSSSACSALVTLKVEVIIDSQDPTNFYPPQSRSATSPPPDLNPTGPARQVLALPLLLDAFVQGAALGDIREKRKGDLHFLASVFANLTIAPAGREFFLTTQSSNPLLEKSSKEYPLAKVIPFTEHKDTIRRGGVASVIKNCSFTSQAHKAMLSSEDITVAVPPSAVEAPGIGILPYILLPLAGPEEFELEDQEKLPDALQLLPPEKKREPDQVLRLMHVESLLLLCHTRWGRDYLREHGTYEIVRAAHENETVDKISEHIERLVTLLKGDEPKDPLPEDLDEEEVGKGLSAVTMLDEDDEDNRIEEL